MKRFFSGLILLAMVVSFESVSRAAVIVYSQNFEVDDSANWTTNTGAADGIADVFYDYSAIGVPSAPGGGTRGLKLTANNSAAVLGGINASPTGQSFTGSYRVSFNIWQNYVGPLGVGGSGTTQLSTYGIGTAGTTNFLVGSNPGSVVFAHTLDGGSGADYRVYSSAAPVSYASGNPVYAAPGGAINNNNAYYSVFTAESAPAAQLALFPGQTLSTDLGEAAFLWRSVTIDVVNDPSLGLNSATWSIDGLRIATVDLNTVTLSGGNILFGHHDTNAGVSTDANRSLLNVTLIDNISVTAVPEPSALALVLVGAVIPVIRRGRLRSVVAC